MLTCHAWKQLHPAESRIRNDATRKRFHLFLGELLSAIFQQALARMIFLCYSHYLVDLRLGATRTNDWLLAGSLQRHPRGFSITEEQEIPSLILIFGIVWHPSLCYKLDFHDTFDVLVYTEPQRGGLPGITTSSLSVYPSAADADA